MKMLNDYMNMSYRMEIVEDKDEGGFVFFLTQIYQAVLHVEKQWKVRWRMH